MDIQKFEKDWRVTPEKIDEAVRLIVAVANPLQIILFGSRARGDHRPDSDVDLAVIIDAPEEEVHQVLPYSVLLGIKMEITLVVVSQQKYDLHRPWLNSVYNYIDREGIILYDQQHSESARSGALRISPTGRIDAAIPFA